MTSGQVLKKYNQDDKTTLGAGYTSVLSGNSILV